MRSHSDIVKAIGPEKLASDRGVSIHTARSWEQRDSIPGPHWLPISQAGWATLDELAAYAATRKPAGIAA